MLAVAVAFVFTAAGAPLVLNFVNGWAGAQTASMIAGLSALDHFEGAARGVVEIRSLFYFFTLIAMFLSFTALAVEARREG